MKKNYKIKIAVLDRDCWTCTRCGEGLYLRKSYKLDGERKAHVHHVVPKSKGGKYKKDNLLSTCWKCECKGHEKTA
uniref:Putative homing endonuclease n=1 Tax=viral metagenome TaxID=1070528 RepID=A0A6M3IMW3_9ZZZZ